MLHEYRRRVALDPASAAARAALGEALLRAGQAREASEQFERALALDPLHREARRLLIGLLIEEGRHVRAGQILGEALRRAPHDPVVRDDIADVLLRDGRTDDGLFQLVRADELAPAPTRTRKVVELCLARRYLARARRALERYASSAGEDVWVHATRAEIAAALGEHAGPARSPIALGEAFLWGRLRARLARLRADALPAALVALVAQIKQGEPAQVKRALVLLPDAPRASALASWVKATLAACAADLVGAERLLGVAIDGPDPIIAAFARADRADVFFTLGRLTEAAADYAAAAAAAPDDADLAEAHGDVLTQLDPKAARAAYERAAKLAPGGAAAQKLALLRVRAVQRDAERPFGAMKALGWHAHGGAVTPVQAAWVSGDGALSLTGRVKRSGEEQAKIVYSLLKQRASQDKALDLHLHYEDTENEKDGPSAGLALALAAISASRRAPLRDDLAATGELTLQGTVRAVGGLHEKLTAAALAGVTRVLVPLKNLQALEQLSPDLRAALEIIPVNVLDEALAFAFDEPRPQGEPP